MVIQKDICVNYDASGNVTYYRTNNLTEEVPSDEIDNIRRKGEVYFFPSCNRFASALQVNKNVTKVVIKEEQLKQLFEMMETLIQEYDKVNRKGVEDEIRQGIRWLEEIEKKISNLSEAGAVSSLIDSVRDQIPKIKSEIASLLKNHSLAKQIRDRDQIISDLNKKITDLEDKLNKCNEEFTILKSLLSQKENEIESLTNKLNQMVNLKDGVNQTLTKNMAALTQEKIVLNDRIASLNANVENLTNDILQKDQAHKNEIDALNQKLSALDSEKNELTQERDKLMASITKLEDEAVKINAENENKKNQLVQINKDLQSLQDKEQKQQDEINQLKGKYDSSSVDEKDRLNRTYTKLKASQEMLKDRKEQLEEDKIILLGDKTEDALNNEWNELREEIKRSNDHIKSLESKIKEKDEEIKTLTDERDRFSKNTESMNDQINSLQTKLTELQDQIQAKQKELDESKLSLNRLKLNQNNREIDYKNQEETLTQLKKEIETLTEKNVKGDSSIREQLKQIKEQAEKLQESQEKIKSLEDKILQKQNELSQKDESINDKNSQLTLLNEKYNLEVSNATNTIKDLNNKIKELSNEINVKEQSIDLLKAEVNENNKKIQEKNEEISNLNSQINSLLVEQTTSKSQIEEQKNKSTQSDEEIQRLEKEKEKIEENLNETKTSLSNASSELKDLKKTNLSLEEELKTVKEQSANMSNRNDELLKQMQGDTNLNTKALELLKSEYESNLESAKTENDRLSNLIEESKNNISSLQKEYKDNQDKWNKEKSKLEEEKDKVDRNSENLQKELKLTTDKYTDSETKVNELNNKLSNLESLRDQTQENYNKIKTDYELLKNKQSISERHISTLENTEKDQKERLNELTLKVNELTAELESEKKNKNKLDTKINSLEEEIKESKNKEDELNNQIKTLKNEIDQLRDEKNSKENDLINTKRNLEEEKEKVEQKENELNKKNNDITTLESKNKALSETLENAQREGRDNIEEINKAKEEANNLKVEIQRLNSELSSKDKQILDVKNDSNSQITKINELGEKLKEITSQALKFNNENTKKIQEHEETIKSLNVEQSRLVKENNTQQELINKQIEDLIKYKEIEVTASSLSKQLNDLQNQVGKLTRKNKDLEIALEEYEKERASYQKQMAEMLGEDSGAISSNLEASFSKLKNQQEENRLLQKLSDSDQGSKEILKEIAKVLDLQYIVLKSTTAEMIKNEVTKKITSLQEEIRNLKSQIEEIGASQAKSFESTCLGSRNDAKACVARIGQEYTEDIEPRLMFVSVYESMKAAYEFQSALGKPVVGLLFQLDKGKLYVKSALVIVHDQNSNRHTMKKLDFSSQQEISLIEVNGVKIDSTMSYNTIVLSFYNTVPSLQNITVDTSLYPELSDELKNSIEKKLVLSYVFYAPHSQDLMGEYIEDSELAKIKKEYDELIGSKDRELEELKTLCNFDKISKMTIKSCDDDKKNFEELKINLNKKKDELEILKNTYNDKSTIVSMLDKLINKIDQLLKEYESIDSTDCDKISKYLNKKELNDLNDAIANVNEDIRGSTRVYIRIKPEFKDGKVVTDTRISIGPEAQPRLKLLECKDVNGKQPEYGPFYRVIPDINRSNVFVSDPKKLNEVIRPEQVFSTIQDTVGQAMKGYSIIFFGYGLSGSGKTYTLLGDQPSNGPSVKGLLQMSIEYFKDHKMTPVIHKIQEEYIDTFDKGTTGKPTLTGKIMEIDNNIPNLSLSNKTDTSSIDWNGKLYDINFILRSINTYRTNLGHIKKTVNNPQSSRSHLYITIQIKDDANDIKGYITFIDMAGRESPLKVISDATGLEYDEKQLSSDLTNLENLDRSYCRDITKLDTKKLNIKTDNKKGYKVPIHYTTFRNKLNNWKKKKTVDTDISEKDYEDYIKMINQKIKDVGKKTKTDYCMFIDQLLEESIYINESINYMTYYLNNKQNSNTKKPEIYNDIAKYQLNKVLNPIPDISKLSKNDNIKTNYILDQLDQLGEGTPSKFVMICATRQEADRCADTKATLEFAQTITSTK